MHLWCSRIALRIGLKSPSAVYFSSVTNIYCYAARALLRPAQNRTFQLDDVPGNISELYTTEYKNCKNVFFTFCLNDNQQNYFKLFMCI